MKQLFLLMGLLSLCILFGCNVNVSIGEQDPTPTETTINSTYQQNNLLLVQNNLDINNTNTTKSNREIHISDAYNALQKQKDEAISYNDQLMDIIEHCTSSEKIMYQTIADNSNIKIVSSSVDDAITNCKKSLSDLKKLKSFDGDTDFRGSIKNLLDLENHYLNLIKQSLVYYDVQTMTDYQKKQYQNINDNMGKDEMQSSELMKKVTREQEKFAQKYGFSLSD